MCGVGIRDLCKIDNEKYDLRSSKSMLKRMLKLMSIALALFSALPVIGQNVSNEGKLFWVGHMGHIDGAGSNFALYITTAANSSAAVRVSIPGGTYNQIHIIPSNQVTVVTLPSSQTYLNCTDCIRNQAVKIESLNHPVVVYAHIYSNARSDATLLIPVETWGKEYYTISNTQNPTNSNARSQFMVIAVEDSTFVDIYPSTAILPSKPANTKYTVMLMAGEVYHAQSVNDMSGTRLVARSANGISCKNVAAFSGSSFTRVGCSATTADNLYQQLFPTTSWGMEFITAPLKTRTIDEFRVLAKYDGTKVKYNNDSIMLDEGEYYTFQSATDNYILADNPITLAQFPRTQGCDAAVGDPTMIVIPPIEQMVKNVTMYSSPYQNITGQYLNILTRTNSISSFELDGNPVTFTTMTNNSDFAYARETVSSGNHHMVSDSFFQVVAYGFGNVESYGYAGGTNIKNLVQSISVSADSICLGDTIDFTANVNYVPSSMKWYFGDGSTDTSNYTPRHYFSQPGEYAVSLVTRKDGLVDCGSTDSTVYRVRVHAFPSASYSMDEQCLEDTFRFADLSQSNSTFSYVSNWQWRFGDSTTSTQQNPIKYFSREGNFATCLIVQNNHFCGDTIYAQHHVNPHPEIDLVVNDTCPGFPNVFEDRGSINSGSTISWDWLIDSTTQQNGSQFQLVSSSGQHRVELLVESDSGCHASDLDSFTVYEPVVANFSVSSVCEGMASIPVDSSINAQDYTWYFSDTTYNGAPVPYVLKSSGVHLLKLVVASPDACLDSFTTSTEVFLNPPSSFTTTGTCIDDSYTFDIDFDTSLFPGMQYNWILSGALASGPNAVHDYTSDGPKNIRLSTETKEACQGTTLSQVYVNPQPNAQILQDIVCEFQTSTLWDVSNYKSSGIGFRNWMLQSTGSIDSSVQLNVDGSNADWVYLEIQTDSGCYDRDSLYLDYHPLPTADFTVTGVCPQVLIQFDNSSTIPNGYSLAQVDWDIANEIILDDENVSKAFNYGGVYSAKMIVQSNAGCRDSVVKRFTILEHPQVKVIEQESCVEQDFTIADSSKADNQNVIGWDWKMDGQTFSGRSFSYSYLDSGYYTYTLSLQTDSGCIYTDVFTDSIWVHPEPLADFRVDPQLTTSDEPEIAFTNASLGGQSFHWKFGDGEESFLPNPNHRFSDTGTFLNWLIVSSQFGCTDSTVNPVSIKAPLQCHFPTAFTPNGDERNPIYLPVCVGFETFKMTIYNRWGQVVYETDKYAGWDPQAETNRVYPDGIYLYTAWAQDFTGKRFIYKGTFTLIR